MRILAQKILQQALANGATAGEVMISTELGLTTTVRMGEVDVIEYSREQGIAVTVYVDHHVGSAGCSELSEQAIAKTVNKAINIAKFTQTDPYRALADKELLAYHYPDLNLHHPWAIQQQEAIDLAKQCEAIGLNYDKAISNSEGVTVDTSDHHYVYANTHDFIGSYKSTQHSISAAFIAQSGSDMERDYEYSVARDFHDLLDINTLAISAAERTLKRLGARKIKTQKTPIIFAANIARGFLGHFISAISGGNLYRKSSFLVDHLDKSVFPENIHLIERPHLPKALGSTPFDTEGVATVERTIVAAGVLKSYILGSYSARKLNMRSTGNADGVHNLFINTGSEDLAGLMRQMGRGLLVTELIGQGVNIVTGDYSRGAFGYWIENGEIQFPVCEVTIAGNLRDMFMNIAAIANDVDHRGSIHSGSILVEGMMVAGE